MLRALKISQLIEKYSIQLLKFSLSGDQQDFWRVYDELLEMMGYVRIKVDDETCIVTNNDAEMYNKFEQVTRDKLSQVQQLQKDQQRRLWQQERHHSDQFQYSSSIYCILTPLNYSINYEIHQKTDYGFHSYVFVSGDYVIHSNRQAQDKGIFKGLPVLLLRKIDPDAKVIQISKFSNNKFQQLYEIFTERYKDLNSTLQSQQIHFTLHPPKHQTNIEELLKNQMKVIVEDIYEISRVKMFAFISKSQLVCNILVKDTPLQLINSKEFQPMVLLNEQSVQQALQRVRISSLPGMSRNIARFLNTLQVQTVGQLLRNLHILDIITSPQQTQIFLETCLGIDHRQTQPYIQEKKRQFQLLGLDYDRLFPNTQSSSIQCLKRETKIQSKQNSYHQEFDLDSVKSQKVHNVVRKQPQKNPKSQKNFSKTPQIDTKQQYFPLFGNKTKK